LKRSCLIFLTVAVPLACLCMPPPVAAQRPGMGPSSPHGNPSDTPSGVADLIIQLQDESKTPYLEPTKVTLQNSKGDLRGTTIAEKGRAVFRGIPLDSYQVSVEVSGSPTISVSVPLQMAGESRILDLMVRPGAASGSSGPRPPPPFTLREQKELTAGLRALQAQKLDEARKHFLSAAKTAPNHPDVDYLLGVLASMSGDVAAAKQYFEAAADNYQHVRSLTALGEIDLMEGNLGPAKSHLEAALHADPNGWRAMQLLAAVELRRHSYVDAIRNAEQALARGKTEAKGAQLTLAEAFGAVGNYDRSTQVLHELLKQSPSQEQEKEAQRLLEANRRALAPSSASEGAASYFPASNAALYLVTLPLAPSLPARTDNPLTENPRWIPPNVDDAVPPVEAGAACPLLQIVEEAGKRVLELANNLDRFTATERLSHQTLNEFGLAVRAEQLSFNYLVGIHEVKPGIFDVSEYRNGSDSREIFPERVATLGTVALVFVFHPNYAEDFDFQCEGLAHQGDKPVWQVHFQQKPGRQSRIRSYRLGTQYYRVGIKGRAWISADSFEVLRMESDLVGKVPELRLNAEHQDTTYGPVPFQKRDIVLWLPHSSETYLDFNGHRIHRRQDFSNYLLFWVEDRQHIEKPAETQADQPNAPNG